MTLEEGETRTELDTSREQSLLHRKSPCQWDSDVTTSQGISEASIIGM